MLVAVEGVDGAGKRTLTRELVALATEAGVSASVVSFPRYGRTVLSQVIADDLSGSRGAALDPHPLAAVFAAERLESRPALLAELEQHDLVVLDRYVASNMAYQAAKLPPDQRDELITWVETLELGTFALPRPDLMVFLRIPVAEAMRRTARRDLVDGRPSGDRHEADGTLLAECDRVYAHLAEHDVAAPWAVLDTRDRPDWTAPEMARHLWDTALAPRLTGSR